MRNALSYILAALIAIFAMFCGQGCTGRFGQLSVSIQYEPDPQRPLPTDDGRLDTTRTFSDTDR